MSAKEAGLEDDTKKYGEPLKYDPDFNGPIKNRSCTDILCLLLFVIFLVVWLVVAFLSVKWGNPESLVFPSDSAGNICGEGNFQDRPYLYFFDLSKCARLDVALNGCPTPQVCISKCPNETYSPFTSGDVSVVTKPYKDFKDKNKLVCKYNIDETKDVKSLVDEGFCAPYVVASDDTGDDFLPRKELLKLGIRIKNPFVGRCVPLLKELKGLDNLKSPDIIANATDVIKGSEFIQKVLDLRNIGELLFQDFKTSWPIIIVALALAMLFSLIWIVMMRWIAWLMVWLSIFLLLGLLCAGCWFSFNRYLELKNNQELYASGQMNSTDDSTSKGTALKRYLDQKNTWLAFGIIIAVILAILLLMIIFLRNRIRLAIALIEEGSKAVGNVMTSLFFPLIPFILQLLVIALWIAVAVHIASANVPKAIVVYEPFSKCQQKGCEFSVGQECDRDTFGNSTCATVCPEAVCSVKFESQRDNIKTFFQLFNLFGLLWGLSFVVGLGQMVLAGTFATWYWAFDKSNVPTFVISASFYRTFRYHLGSLAFGSLLIAIVQMIRIFLEYIDRKLKEYTDNPAVKCLMCCLKCCFWCLEKFIKFINRNAYIMVAVYGKNFCVSAKNAFFLLMRNIARVVVLDKVTDFLLFLGKMTIVAGVGVLSFFFYSDKIKPAHKYVPDLNYPLFPVALICIGSYAIASCFFSVYSMAVDTLFLCFLEDCEKNDGSAEKPYRMSKNLMKILGKKNKKLMEPE